MMTIKLDDSYKIQWDGLQWSLFEFKESVLITFGRFEGTMSKPRWVDLSKHTPNLDYMLMLYCKIKSCNTDEELTLKEYIERYQQIGNDVRKVVKEALGETDKELKEI